MSKFKIEHDRPNCIGCGACAALVPEHWIMDDDGKSNILNGKRLPDHREEKDIEEKDYKQNYEAAECCPVNVIHLVEKDTKKRII
jgi:ferredoxin